jgi:hypothetical protein
MTIALAEWPVQLVARLLDASFRIWRRRANDR